MTTDITELAQSLKAAAENAIGAHERLAAYPYGEIIDISQHEGEQIDIDITDLNEFNKEANPVNILALVEALEKVQQVDEELCKLLPPGVEYMDPPDGGDVTPLEGVRRMVADYRQLIAELESRTVKLPPELYTIGELIRTQDNRITDQPMFVVFQKREIIGSDEHSPSRICWVWDGEEVSELRAKRLEALYQDGRDTRGYDRYAMQEVDEFVTACFTEHGCKDYLRQNGHNLRLPYIYACGSFRNNEYQLVRNWLAGIKVEAE
ncbi:ead/Ea22-like family protein [Klebsiella pneumoniae]|uniref:ead/Ea22-like family protein n=1 Tax=Klebsiella pneumoniae TaxID=573 RepID=UPI0018902C8D|nr:ead/Ea22-like family protein [Klebsiella pneumoniae]